MAEPFQEQKVYGHKCWGAFCGDYRGHSDNAMDT